MNQAIVKVFNTVGPCVAEKHYLLPVLERQPGIDEMIEGKYYFTLHAPKQSGKTTYLKSLTNRINLEGKYYALYCSLEANNGVTDDAIAMTRIVVEINKALKYSTIDKLYSLSTLSSSTDPLPNFDPSIKVSFF
ncbi:MAG: hypothetical protein LBS60_10935 [Deltaproteobacteria bacterium]|nr:hypothetical protein [Deltaproteobacteria bacterium]